MKAWWARFRKDEFFLVKTSIVVTTIAILVYDVLLIQIFGRFRNDFENTISSQLLEWSIEYPVVTTASAVLLGHLYVPAKSDSYVSRFWPLKILAALLAIGALYLKLNAWWLLATGVYAGHALWNNAWRGKR